MAGALIIVGAVLQSLGLGLVFVELAIIRSDELGIPSPWTRIRRRVRRLLGRSKVAQGSSRISAVATLSARGKARPGVLAQDASAADRIARLERYVEHLDRDVDGLYRAIDRQAEEVTAAAKRREQELRDEIARSEAERRSRLARSLRRQGAGGLFVVCGLIAGTWGSLISL